MQKGDRDTGSAFLASILFAKRSRLDSNQVWIAEPEGGEQASPIFEERTLTLGPDGTAPLQLSPPAGVETLRLEVVYDKAGNFTDSDVVQTEHIYAAKSPTANYVLLNARQGLHSYSCALGIPFHSTEPSERMIW